MTEPGCWRGSLEHCQLAGGSTRPQPSCRRSRGFISPVSRHWDAADVGARALGPARTHMSGRSRGAGGSRATDDRSRERRAIRFLLRVGGLHIAPLPGVHRRRRTATVLSSRPKTRPVTPVEAKGVRVEGAGLGRLHGGADFCFSDRPQSGAFPAG
jgi:hypothetical protein